MKKILITGVSGYLGPYLLDALTRNKDLSIWGLFNNHPIAAPGVELNQCDLTDFEKLRKIFSSVKPDIVYHLASVTPTRIKDQDEDYIEYFNSRVTWKIAELCSAHNSLMIYTSTDLVYENGFDINEETSPLNPLSVYARTKLLGENSVREKAAKHIILRLALVYGFSRSTYISFFDECYKALSSGKEVRAFYDQFRNPLYTEDAAEILASLPGKYRHNEIINLCGEETLSRFEMCEQLAAEFSFDWKLVSPASCEEFIGYPMVKNLSLSNRKLKELGYTTDSYKNNLHRSIKYKP